MKGIQYVYNYIIFRFYGYISVDLVKGKREVKGIQYVYNYIIFEVLRIHLC